MMSKSILPLALFPFFSPIILALPSASSSSTCVTAIGIPSLDPDCLPLKAEGANAAPSPKFLFSANNYCTSFSGKFASITVIPDRIPAGTTCTVFTFDSADCTGISKESASSGGCIQISDTPSARSALLKCE